MYHARHKKCVAKTAVPATPRFKSRRISMFMVSVSGRLRSRRLESATRKYSILTVFHGKEVWKGAQVGFSRYKCLTDRRVLYGRILGELQVL